MNPATLRVGTWNILGRRRDQQLGLAADGAVRRTLDAVKQLDVLCLQEVHFYNGHPDEQLCTELRMMGLSHFVGRPLSPSHLDTRAELGVCIAARFPLRNPYLYRLTNPGLRARVRGADWLLHDKGLVGADLDLGSRDPVKVHSLHLFPFFEFGVCETDDHVKRMWSELWHYVDRLGKSTRMIMAGDYNHSGRPDAAKEWSDQSWSFCVSEEVATTRIGLSLDDVAINWPAPLADPSVVPTFSDHHLVIVELALSPALPHPKVPGGSRRAAQSRSPVR